MRRRELREDEQYLETEVAQAKVDKIKIKMALSETHNKCEAQNFQNQSQHEALEL